MKNKFTGLTLKDVNSENMKEWLKTYYRDYSFRFIFKNKKKSRLKEIEKYNQNGQYFVFNECVKSPLITLKSNISLNGINVNELYLDKVDSIEVYYK